MFRSQGRLAPSAAAAAGSIGAAVLLSAAGGLALALGVLVYMADRSPGHVALMPAFMGLGTGPLFGALGLWLPSFAHPFAFGLFSAALRAPGPTPAYGACAGWWMVNVLFELGQHERIAPTLVDALGGAGAASAPARALAGYFAHGRFDMGDLLAATLGALAAAALLRAAHRKEACHVW